MRRFCGVVLVVASAFSSFGSSRPAFGAEARLRLGIVSDLHIGSRGFANGGKCGNADVFEHALSYFRDRAVDAVVVAGDIADYGLVDQLEAANAAWERVFPGGRGANGATVERLFVYGNHDIQKWTASYERWYRLPHEDFRPENRIERDPAAAWEKAFGEKYEPIRVRTVKGYTFVCSNYIGYPEKCDFLERHRDELAGDKPFFFVQHCPPKGTVTPLAWGQDAGFSTAALARFPNAVAISGHTHVPLVDERTVWQGAFTSIGTGSLRYLAPLSGRENKPHMDVVGAPVRQMEELKCTDCQQGLLMTVFDDRMELERRDFAHDKPLGKTWVIALPFDGSLSFERRAAGAALPAFGAGAAPSVRWTRGRDSLKREVEQAVVTFPPARAPVRALDYEVSVEIRDKDVLRTGTVKRVYGKEFYMAPETELADVTCVFAREELPKAYLPPAYSANPKVPNAWPEGLEYRFAVRPCDSWGRKGSPIFTDWTCGVMDRIHTHLTEK